MPSCWTLGVPGGRTERVPTSVCLCFPSPSSLCWCVGFPPPRGGLTPWDGCGWGLYPPHQLVTTIWDVSLRPPSHSAWRVTKWVISALVKPRWGLPRQFRDRESSCSVRAAGDASSIPGSGRSPAGGCGNPLQRSCLESPTDRGAWWAAVHGVVNQIWLSNWARMQSHSGDLTEAPWISAQLSHWLLVQL